MKLFLLSLGLFLFSYIGFSQKIKITVVDISETPIENVSIVDSEKIEIAQTNEKGVVTVDKSIGIIGLTKKGYTDRWIKISDSKQKEVVIEMDYYYLELDVIDVEESKPEYALSIDAVNIIDYFPFGESILTIKRNKEKYYIGVDSLGKEGVMHEFTLDKPRNFFMDCIGNMHIICPQRVYQIAFTETELIIIDDISKDLFNLLLEPCVANFGDNYVMKSLSFNNQAYSLALYDKYKDPVMFYYQIDKVSAQIAAEEALKLEFSIRSDVFEDSMEQHVLELRRFVRELYEGDNPDANLDFIMNSFRDPTGRTRRWTEQYAMYKVFSYPIDIRSFRVGNGVAVVDFENDSLSIYSEEGKKMSQVPFKVQGKIKDVWQDVSNDNIYLYTRNNGNYYIYYLNDITGEVSLLKSTRDLGVAKGYRIYNQYLYYLQIENGYYKIHRVKLPKHWD